MRRKIITNLNTNQQNTVNYLLGGVSYDFFFFYNARNDTLEFDLSDNAGNLLFPAIRMMLNDDILGYRNVNNFFHGKLGVQGDDVSLTTIDVTSILFYDDLT